MLGTFVSHFPRREVRSDYQISLVIVLIVQVLDPGVRAYGFVSYPMGTMGWGNEAGESLSFAPTGRLNCAICEDHPVHDTEADRGLRITPFRARRTTRLLFLPMPSFERSSNAFRLVTHNGLLLVTINHPPQHCP